MKESKLTDYGLIISVGLLALGMISIFIPFNILDGFTLGRNVIHIGKYNELGDFVNGITSPFLSMAAFILLFLTYSSQKTELRLNRSILEKQYEQLSKQQFESTFFNLLNLHNQIVNAITTESLRRSTVSKGVTTEERRIITGRECFIFFYEQLRAIYHQMSRNIDKSKEPIFKDGSEKIDVIYYEFFMERQSDLGHYFRNLYQIIKFVDDSHIPNKQDYINLIGAQLSSSELLILCFNCLSRFGKEFKVLIEKYSLLKSISNDNELLRYECRDLFDKKAFGQE
jgi:hypothetical protein